MENMEGILGIIMVILAIIGAYIMVVYIRKFKNIERMAIIDKGLNPDMFKEERTVSVSLRFSLLLMGAGVGLLVGYCLDRAFYMQEVGYFSMLLIFGGAGLGLAYLVEEKKTRQQP